MTDVTKPLPPVFTYSDTCYQWWLNNLSDRENTKHRALAAKLRRASLIDAMLENEVQILLKQIRAISVVVSVDRVVALSIILANIREYDTNTLATRMGETVNNRKVVSESRFQKLIRAEDADFIGMIPNKLKMVGRKCNIGRLSSDVIKWNDSVKTKWCLDYFA